jgi:glycosyltransferase involved in cell wall biosynthesis
MNEKPLVSVLIPLYNKVDYFEETLDSVLNQTYQNIEIIIVDDGSTDASLNIAKRNLSGKVRIFEQKNKGASAARNKAFELSKGEFIQYLDADDILDRCKIEEQIKVLVDNPNCLAIAQGYDMEMTGGQKKMTLRKRLTKDYTDPKTFIFDEILEAALVHSWLIPRYFIEKTGGWDERISIFDDRDFYLRLVILASKIIFSEKAICYYRITETDNHLSKKRDIVNFQGSLIYFSNAEIFLQKNKNALNESDKKMLSCLYKKLFIVGLHNREVKESLYNRCIKYDVVPDCSNSFIVKTLKKILGVKMSFKILTLNLDVIQKIKLFFNIQRPF